jgi:hypothetical protein
MPGVDALLVISMVFLARAMSEEKAFAMSCAYMGLWMIGISLKHLW